jgi:hypothetical protein
MPNCYMEMMTAMTAWQMVYQSTTNAQSEQCPCSKDQSGFLLPQVVEVRVEVLREKTPGYTQVDTMGFLQDMLAAVGCHVDVAANMAVAGIAERAALAAVVVQVETAERQELVEQIVDCMLRAVADWGTGMDSSSRLC